MHFCIHMMLTFFLLIFYLISNSIPNLVEKIEYDFLFLFFLLRWIFSKICNPVFYCTCPNVCVLIFGAFHWPLPPSSAGDADLKWQSTFKTSFFIVHHHLPQKPPNIPFWCHVSGLFPFWVQLRRTLWFLFVNWSLSSLPFPRPTRWTWGWSCDGSPCWDSPTSLHRQAPNQGPKRVGLHVLNDL